LLRQRSRKKMATLNEHTAAILSDISDGSDTNFIYILSANEWQQRNKQIKHQTKSQPVHKQTHESRD